jgi:hypothetical protein
LWTFGTASRQSRIASGMQAALADALMRMGARSSCCRTIWANAGDTMLAVTIAAMKAHVGLVISMRVFLLLSEIVGDI